jgi:hypothetical protein
MYLFSRTAVVRANPTVLLPWVHQITEVVRTSTSLQVSAWVASFGAPIGGVVWSSLVKSQADLAADMTSLLGNPEYLALLDTGREMTPAAGQDHLRRLVHGSPEPEHGLGSVSSVTWGTATLSRIGETLAWSVEMAQHAEQVTGNPVSVWVSAYGLMGEVTFFSVYDTVAAAEAGQQALDNDPGYIQRLHASEGLWLPGSGNQGRFTRVA